MKYNKKKKLQQGGTLNIKKIMEEARANQAAYRQSLEQEAITKEIAAKEAALLDYERNTKVAAPSTHLNVQGPTLGNITQPATPQRPLRRSGQESRQGSYPIDYSKRSSSYIVGADGAGRDVPGSTGVSRGTSPIVDQVVATVVPDNTVPAKLGVPPVPTTGAIPASARTSNNAVRQSSPHILRDGVFGWLKNIDAKNKALQEQYRKDALNRPRSAATIPNYSSSVGILQQGGKISNDELSVYMAVDYLKAKGISEEDMVGEDGGLKSEYIDMVSEMFSNQPEEILASYEQDPDGTIAQILENEQTPEQIEMAKKGAKLKKLKSKKMRKCKCGCNLILSKEAGGVIVEKCSCGCKNK